MSSSSLSTMGHSLCNVAGCEKIAARRVGSCLLCDKRFCGTHVFDLGIHTCPIPEEDWDAYSTQYVTTEDRHINELCSRIDDVLLCSRASALRNGMPCTIDTSVKKLSSMMGGQNCHAEITFEDGIKWLARLQLVTRTTSPPIEVCDYVLRSEAATMLYLRGFTKVPVPEVFDWACASDPKNLIGLGYIFVEKLEGKPLNWQTLSPPQKEIVLQQLVDIYLDLEQHPLNAIGSLSLLNEDTKKFVVQALASPENPQIGPFPSWLESSYKLLESYLPMIASGEIGVHHPVDVYLMHRFRQDLLCKVEQDNSPRNQQFFLKHPDDKGDHILINEECKIVGIIDWDWTQTHSKAEAFSSPCMLWPVRQFYEGSNELSPDERRLAQIYTDRGCEDLSRFVVNGRAIQRLFFALGVESEEENPKTFRALFKGLRGASGLEAMEWEDWKRDALSEWQSDVRLQRLLDNERMKNRRSHVELRHFDIKPVAFSHSPGQPQQ